MKTTNTPLADAIISGIRNAATELELLRVQISLGKLEAKELFEDVKTEFKERIQKSKDRFNHFKKEEHVLKLINALEFLLVQLALGKAETAELFNEQAKKIKASINETERQIESNPQLKEFYAETHLELEKFRMKLELLELHYKLNKLKVELNFEEKRTEFMARLDKLKSILEEKETGAKRKFYHFKEEVAQAVDHIKKAFTE
jgi:hypothetical protein